MTNKCFGRKLKYDFLCLVKKVFKKRIIVVISGIVLIPGHGGKECMGNGKHKTKNGNVIECCCEECDYLMCCSEDFDSTKCALCTDINCPNSKAKFCK